MQTAVLTDSTDPELASLFTHVVPHTPDMGNYMEPKFYLDKFSPFQENFYVDSDCLAVTDLKDFFEMFKGQSVGIPGWRYLTRQDRDAAVDVAAVLDRFSIPSLPKFNGGCYYFRKCAETTAFFDCARSLLADAGNLKIGFYSGGGFSDEPLFALALALNGLRLTPTGTRGAWTPINSTGPVNLDILAGKCSFRKEGVMVYPDIVHFPLGFRECYAYPREIWKLKKHFGKQLPPFSERTATLLRAISWRLKREARDGVRRILRPAEYVKMPKNPEAIGKNI